jgi:predicted metal-dependent peptidase|tara:strand:- start:7060 stop:8316 length:1257 start_codon:yes stop_codon:yes gene_type:complete
MSTDTLEIEKKELSPEELKNLRAEVIDKIVVARVGLLLRHPFFGNMATRLQIKECDDWCPTAATDGRNLFFNTEFFSKMTSKEIEFVIAHEILHCVFDHMTRREDRDPQLHNIACDYIVNNTLVRDNIGEKPKNVQIFQDWKYDGWASEAVYDDIYKKGKEQMEQLGKLLDEHIDWEKGESTGGTTQGPNSSGKGKGPTYSKEELENIKNEIKESMMSAAQAAGAGNLPAEIERIIQQFTEPKMNWRELLQQQIQSVIKNDYTFSRPSRKGWHSGIILPGTNYDETIDICIAIDTSGSIMNQQVEDFLGEVQSIMEQYRDYNIKIWCFDTDVHNEQDFNTSSETLESYKIEGGGGTDFMANWEYMKENDIVPKKFIMFTDGYTWDGWGDEEYCDTVFVINGHHDKNMEAPFGTTVHYE